jgi:putative chitinase
MILKLGSTGEDVKALQEKLGLKADGSFGPGTEKAVKEWQSKNGLTPDGVVGDKSWSFLLEGKKQSFDASPLSFVQNLKGHIPEAVFQQIPATCAAFKITTPLRLAHFLSQCGHESAGFKAVSENLNYSADGLKKIFGKYFPGDATAYSRNPEKIASKVYANRMGNGDEKSKEGWKFRGRGYLQCTGKSNYESLSKDFGIDFISNPDLVATKYPLSSAAWFFSKNKLWDICDLGSTDDVVMKLTKRINGGTHGYDDRLDRFKKIWILLK